MSSGDVIPFPAPQPSKPKLDLDEMLKLAVQAGNELPIDEPLLVIPPPRKTAKVVPIEPAKPTK